MKIHPSVKLLPVSALAMVRGILDEHAASQAKGFRWVFDLSAMPGAAKDLRIWAGEVENPRAVAGLSLHQVLEELLPGPDALLRDYETAALLRVSLATLPSFRGDLAAIARRDGGRPVWVTRESVAMFLSKRWVKDDQN